MFMALFSSDFAQWNPLQIERDWIHGHLLDCREVGQPSAEVWRAICSVHRFFFMSSTLFCKFSSFSSLGPMARTCVRMSRSGSVLSANVVAEHQRHSSRAIENGIARVASECRDSIASWEREPSSSPSQSCQVEQSWRGRSVNDGQVDTQGWHSYREKGDMKEEMLVLICSFDTGSVPS